MEPLVLGCGVLGHELAITTVNKLKSFQRVKRGNGNWVQ